MFGNRRKRYNGDTAALLPAFGISMEEAGQFKILNVLDIAFEKKYSSYEAALLIAYSFAGGLYQRGLVERAEALRKEKIPSIQNDWIGKGIVRSELVRHWPQMLDEKASKAKQES